MALLLWLTACATPVEDDGLVTWSGWVFADGETSEEARFAAGHVTFWPAPFAESEPVAAEQPYEDYAGYWSVALPPTTPVLVRITGEATRPTIWAGDSPTADGNWFAGALFAVSDPWVEAHFERLGLDGDAWLAHLAAGEVLVIGYPANAEVGCEDLRVELVDGTAATTSCWLQSDDGEVAPVVSGELTWFAAHLPAGELRVAFGGAAEEYVAEPGDVVMAWYLSGGAP